jgi:hypothetical protein
VYSVTPNGGRTANQVLITITGNNFFTDANGSPPTVLIGTLLATNVVVVDAQHITCNVPVVVDPAVEDVTVITRGLTAIGPSLFTYFESVIVTVSPNHGPIAGLTSVTIDGYNFIEGTLVYFDLSLATDIVVIDSRRITCVTPSHSTGFVNILLVEPLN